MKKKRKEKKRNVACYLAVHIKVMLGVPFLWLVRARRSPARLAQDETGLSQMDPTQIGRKSNWILSRK